MSADDLAALIAALEADPQALARLAALLPAVPARTLHSTATLAAGLSIETGRLLIGDESGVNADALGQRVSAEDRSKAVAAVDWLRAVLGEGPVKRVDVARAGSDEGYSSSTLDRAAKILGVVKEREGTGRDHRSTWALPNPPDVSGGSGGSPYPCGIDSHQGLTGVPTHVNGDGSQNTASLLTPTTHVSPEAPPARAHERGAA